MSYSYNFKYNQCLVYYNESLVTDFDSISATDNVNRLSLLTFSSQTIVSNIFLIATGAPMCPVNFEAEKRILTVLEVCRDFVLRPAQD